MHWSIIGVTTADTRSIDYSSYELKEPQRIFSAKTLNHHKTYTLNLECLPQSCATITISQNPSTQLLGT